MYQIHFFPNRPKHNTNSIEEYFFKLLTLFAPAYLTFSRQPGEGGGEGIYPLCIQGLGGAGVQILYGNDLSGRDMSY